MDYLEDMGCPWGLGPPAPQWATAAAVGPGAARTAMGHRRRRGAWGRRHRNGAPPPPWGPGPPAPQRAHAAAMGPGAARTSMGHRRRRRGAWGRPQRVPVKSSNYKEKIGMREIPKNHDLTGNLQCKKVFYQKTYNDPRVDTHLLVVGFRQKQR